MRIPVLFAVVAVALLAAAIAPDSTYAESHSTASPGLVVPAPIESVKVIPYGSEPTGHALEIVAGLPSGCVEPHDSGFRRFGRVILGSVTNTIQVDPGWACTLIYRTYKVTINLGSDFVPGQQYIAVVNNRVITFTAHGEDPQERVIAPAPIESVEIEVLESFPPQYMASIVAGLPGGCAEPGGHEVSREGNEVTIEVMNTRPPGDPICTMIYSTYTVNVNLGSDFVSGETYTVDVNGTIETFIAQ
ncbi:MAG: hypothetical protein GEU80_17055 [Dehalococcoidia bacterium]|nr:hypothetical protein [Dehalococcoidia bacterium]